MPLLDATVPKSGLEICSTVRSEGLLELTLTRHIIPSPGTEQVLVRMIGAPLNPSDIMPLLAGADPAAIVQSGSGDAVMATAPLSSRALRVMAPRMDKAVPVGSEAVGVVVDTGNAPSARALLGRHVVMLADGLYAQYRCMDADRCYAIPDGVDPYDAASFSVNPLTALGLVESARRDGFEAFVQTAAASNLGQMIVRICRADGIPLVNIVRSAAQADMLRAIGAVYVCDSSAPTFDDDLLHAVGVTGATAAFDAVGGGDLASRILTAMEKVQVTRMQAYSRYGSSTRKHVYMYGVLDRSPTELRRAFGSGWSVGGWLLMPFLDQIGSAAADALRARVAAELTTTFASHYAGRISLADVIRPDFIRTFGRRATGEKYLIDFTRGV